MNNPEFCGGLLLVLAACGAPAPSANSAALAAGTDTPPARIGTMPGDGEDSAPVTRKDTARLTPVAAEWTVERTAARLTPGAIGILRSVRQAGHDGFDRVVFEFGGGSVPGYELAYVDSIQHQCGSGEEVRLKGRAWLSVKLQPAQAHDDAGNATVRERSREPGLSNLLELRLTCDFEAHVEWIAGVASRNGYRLAVLSEPPRLVLDIRH